MTTTATPMANLPAICVKLDLIRSELGAYFFERESLIDLIFVSLLARQHMVVYGPPGTGKSDLLRSAMSHIVGARTFLKLMTKTTVPDETEGAIDVPLMMQTGEYRRRRAGKLTDCEVAFLDEVFKANSMILNTMLMNMNEREYEEEGTLHRIPLISLFGASNELPESKELLAFADRFIFKYETRYLTPANRSKLHRRPSGTKYAPTTFLDLSELQLLQSLVGQVTFPDPVNVQYDAVLQAAEDAGLQISDRAVMQAKTIMAASAVLNGRDVAAFEDVELLEHVLWREPKDKTAVKAIVGRVVNPLKARANELIDQAATVYDGLRPLFNQAATTESKKKAMEASAKLTNVMDDIRTEQANNPGANLTPLDKALERVEVLSENVVNWMMGRRERIKEV